MTTPQGGCHGSDILGSVPLKMIERQEHMQQDNVEAAIERIGDLALRIEKGFS